MRPPPAPSRNSRRQARIGWLVLFVVALIWCFVAVRVVPRAAGLGQILNPGQAGKFPIVSNDIEVWLPWPCDEATIVQTLAVAGLEHGATDKLWLAMDSRMRVRSLALADTGVPLGHVRVGPLLLVFAPPDGWQLDSSSEQGLVTLTVECAVRKGHEPGRGLSEAGLFLKHNDKWVACDPGSHVPATGSITIYHHEGVKVTGTGNLVESAAAASGERGFRSSAGGPASAGTDMVRSRWEWQDGLKLFPAIMASPEYVVVSTAGSGYDLGPSVLAYVFPGQEDRAREAIRFASSVIKYYTGILGYPPPEPYRIATVPRTGDRTLEGGYGLMVIPSLVWSGGIGGAPITDYHLHSLVAHEVAHHWWGAVCQPFAAEGGVFLAEGMAGYWSLRALADLGARHEAPAVAGERARDWDGAYRQSGEGVPLAKLAPGPVAGHHLAYLKGPAVLQLFEWYVGREAFDFGCRRFLADCAYGVGDLGGLRRCIEAAAPRSAVGEFWSAWIDSTGLPTLASLTAELVTAADGDGEGEGEGDGEAAVAIQVEIAQSGMFFPMRLPIQVNCIEGASFSGWLDIPAKEHCTSVVPVDVADQPVRILVDPDHMALFANPWRELTAMLAVPVGTGVE